MNTDLIPPYGLVDLPVPAAGKDELDIKAYYEGLADFIAHCETPMTIAIQGDWGSGKSTTLNFVRNLLDKNIGVIEFNTWLYSQFDLGESLVFSMAHEIVHPLSGSSPEGRRLLRFMASLGMGAAKGAVNLAGAATGTTPVTAAVIEALQNATYSDEAPNVIAELKRTHSNFAATVQEYLKKNGQSRLVVIIDDLDRVEPLRAIEILESLKLFFEVSGCVFVLALDFDVVLRGVKHRYGNDFDQVKARRYFDKIIQVPFSMPTASFKVDGILLRTLERSGLNPSDPKNATELSNCLRFVETSVGTNPRSIKRLLNSFELLQLILKARGENLRGGEEPRMAQIVFGLLCAQAAFPYLHTLLIEAAADIDRLDDLLTVGKSGSDEDSIEDIMGDFKITHGEVLAINRFRNHLGNVASDENGILNSRLLSEAISFSTVTSVRAAERVTPLAELALDFSEITTYMKTTTTQHTIHLFELLITKLRSHLDPDEPLSMVTLSTSNQVVLYDADSVEGVQELSTRQRPRVASIGYTRRGLWILFGRPGTTFEGPGGDDLATLAEALEAEIPDRGNNELHFRRRDHGYRMLIDGIYDEASVAKASLYLANIYRIMHSRRGEINTPSS